MRPPRRGPRRDNRGGVVRSQDADVEGARCNGDKSGPLPAVSIVDRVLERERGPLEELAAELQWPIQHDRVVATADGIHRGQPAGVPTWSGTRRRTPGHQLPGGVGVLRLADRRAVVRETSSRTVGRAERTRISGICANNARTNLDRFTFGWSSSSLWLGSRDTPPKHNMID
jgi:hypothetical protein